MIINLRNRDCEEQQLKMIVVPYLNQKITLHAMKLLLLIAKLLLGKD